MTINTKNIIKMLPVEEKFKLDLLNEFDFYDPDTKFEVEQIIWRAFREYYKIRLDQNLQLAFVKAGNNQESFDPDFYKRIREQTEKEIEEESVKNVEAIDLSAARKAMEVIVKEIKASKKNVH
jgi:hypothetical protein